MHLKKRHLLAFLGLSIGLLSPSPVSASASVSLVTAGLDSPRGIEFFGSRALVAESGHGSNSPADCFAPPGAPPGFQICIGNTSKITWVNRSNGDHETLASGFFSISLGGQETIGVSGLAVRDGKIYAQIGGTSREVPPTFAIGKEAGMLISVNPDDGTWKGIAPVGDKDFDWTTKFPVPDPATCGRCPGTQEHDANPTSVIKTANALFVADSGSNTLTEISDSGKWSIVHHFPWRNPNLTAFPSDEVPTCVTTSGDPTFWVGTLAGHLYKVTNGQATRVVPKDSTGHALLSHVTGCASDGHGTLYLANMFGPGTFGDATFADGSVVKYNTLTGGGSMLVDAFKNPLVFLPYSPKIGPDGMLYVTAGAVCMKSGANPFPSGPNPCTIGTAKGGRVLRIAI